jgi:transposase InsO family protein
VDQPVSRWRSAFARPFSGPATGRESNDGGAGRGDREAAAAADERGRDRRDARDAVVDGVGDPDPARAGRGSAGWGSSSRSGTNARGRASSCTSTSRSSVESKAAPASARSGTDAAAPPALTPTATATRGSKGWEYVHIAIDDSSRLAYAEVLGDEKASTATGFLQRAIAFYARYGITVERVLTDNGPCYRATLHALACRRLGIRHLRTRPYRPQTNGKAERFIRTLLNGWAHGPIDRSSSERTAALDGWLWHYNHRRRHSALSHQPPASRTNLLGSYN